MSELNDELREVEHELESKIEDQKENLTKLKPLKEKKNQYNKLKRSVKQLESKIEDLEDEIATFDVSAKKKKLKKKIQKFFQKRTQKLLEASSSILKEATYRRSQVMFALESGKFNAQTDSLKSTLKTANEEMEEIEEEYEQIQVETTRLQKDMKAKKREAVRSCDGVDPRKLHQENKPLYVVFECVRAPVFEREAREYKLPCSLIVHLSQENLRTSQHLENIKHRFKKFNKLREESTAAVNRTDTTRPPKILEIRDGVEILIRAVERTALMKVSDDEVLEKYQERVKLIEKYRVELAQVEKTFNDKSSTLQAKASQWKSQIRRVCDTINTRFGQYMKKMDAQGEVLLEEHSDFAQWQVVIRVAFRDDNTLQRLVRTRQSGGEKTVSTMLYVVCVPSIYSFQHSNTNRSNTHTGTYLRCKPCRKLRLDW